MADLTPEQIAAQQAEAQKQAEQAKLEERKNMRNEIMREMSKEYGFNLFDADGIKSFKEFTENQKTDLEKSQEVIKGFTEEKAKWESERLELNAKLQASALGIHQDNLEDALKLAGGDPSKLEEVVKKYPVFKSQEGIKIGVQQPSGQTPPNGKTEVEQYMAENYKGSMYYTPPKK